MSLARTRLILSVVLCLGLVPAVLLAWQRVQFERAYQNVALVLDYQDAVIQARENGLSEEDLLAQYKAQGVAGIAVYEPSLARLVQTDKVIYRSGSEWRNERLSQNKSVVGIQSNEYYLRSLEPGAAETFRAKYRYPTRDALIDNQLWIAFPLNVSALPAGPDTERMQKLEDQGFFVVYRPGNDLAVTDPGADFPEVKYIVYAGDEVVGNGDAKSLELVRQRTEKILTGVVEATEQDGIDEIAKRNPVVRVFAMNPAWQSKLQPEEVASKFVLAARERNHRLLYVRPYHRIEDTVTMLEGIKTGLTKAGFVYGEPGPLEFDPDPWLRRLALVGPLAALGLLATCFPWAWLGVAVALGLVGVCAVVGGFGASGAALLAACVFPVLGFALHRSNNLDWLRATLVSLAGGLFVSALGAGRNEVLALEPFRGVALTLVLPPALLLLSMLPKQDIRKTIRDLWNTPINLGTVALLGIGVLAVVVVVMRRGNTPTVGPSATEAKIRAALQDSLIRPRTKEMLLHPLAMLALGNNKGSATRSAWPVWFGNILLAAGVIGQGSIIDSFAHYHTPLLITLLRTVNGIVAGALIGVVVFVVARVAQQFLEQRQPEGRNLEQKTSA